MDEIQHIILEARKFTMGTLEQSLKLMDRCPVDFAIMKRMPLLDSLKDGAKTCLLDLADPSWTDDFQRSLLLKGTSPLAGNTVSLKDGL